VGVGDNGAGGVVDAVGGQGHAVALQTEGPVGLRALRVAVENPRGADRQPVSGGHQASVVVRHAG